jgi:hypothetical protein
MSLESGATASVGGRLVSTADPQPREAILGLGVAEVFSLPAMLSRDLQSAQDSLSDVEDVEFSRSAASFTLSRGGTVVMANEGPREKQIVIKKWPFER